MMCQLVIGREFFLLYRGQYIFSVLDFIDLNKACPKDSYPLPCIDQLVDSTTGHQLLSFIDAFLRYNQIKMDEVDQEKTSFIISQCLFCYKVMPIGLKNAGATYQRLINHMFCP